MSAGTSDRRDRGRALRDSGRGSPVIRLRSVVKRFGAHVAVDGLSLDVPERVVFGLLGPNGSGKTTAIRLALGILGPDEGEVGLLGGLPDHRRRARVGYLPEERGLYPTMKVLEQLVFLAEIRGLERADGEARARRWLERLELDAWSGHRLHQLSKGMQQKVQFIGAVLHDPDLLVLDEPFVGLDPLNQDVLEEIARGLVGGGSTILLSTHLMDQAERLCDRVCLISRGKKVLEGGLSELKRAGGKGVVAVTFEGPDDWTRRPEVRRRERVGDELRLSLRPDVALDAPLRWASEAGARVGGFTVVQPSLHELFVRHTGGPDP